MLVAYISSHSALSFVAEMLSTDAILTMKK